MKSFFPSLIMILFLFLISCNKDPCEAVICMNDGYCENGECVCPEGFEGSDCDEQITPKSITIHRIIAADWPETNNGVSWDSSSTADIYASFSVGNNVVWESSYLYPDVSSSHDYIFDVNPSITLEPYTRCSVSLWDNDSTTVGMGEYMGTVEVYLYIRSGFPMRFKVNGEDVSFYLDVTYTF